MGSRNEIIDSALMRRQLLPTRSFGSRSGRRERTRRLAGSAIITCHSVGSRYAIFPDTRPPIWRANKRERRLKGETPMGTDPVRTSAIVAAFVLGLTPALAQQPSPPAEPQQQLQQERAQQTPSGKMGKEEPSSRAETAKPQDSAVLINGALAVPGAATDTDTIPAKF